MCYIPHISCFYVQEFIVSLKFLARKEDEDKVWKTDIQYICWTKTAASAQTGPLTNVVPPPSQSSLYISARLKAEQDCNSSIGLRYGVIALTGIR